MNKYEFECESLEEIMELAKAGDVLEIEYRITKANVVYRDILGNTSHKWVWTIEFPEILERVA